jgi:Surface lipoprotein
MLRRWSRYRFVTLLIGAVLCSNGCQTHVVVPQPTAVSAKGSYDYPIASPYAATVVGTPPEVGAQLPARIPAVEADGPGPYLVLPIFGPSSLRDGVGLLGDFAARYFYLYVPTDMDEHMGWAWAYTIANSVDTRHTIPFPYYQTGSPFEYDLIRFLYTKKREFEVAQ